MYSVSVILCDLSRVLKICQFPNMLRGPAVRSMTPASELVEIPPEHRNVFTTRSAACTRVDAYSCTLGGSGSGLCVCRREEMDVKQINKPSQLSHSLRSSWTWRLYSQCQVAKRNYGSARATRSSGNRNPESGMRKGRKRPHRSLTAGYRII